MANCQIQGTKIESRGHNSPIRLLIGRIRKCALIFVQQREAQCLYNLGQVGVERACPAMQTLAQHGVSCSREIRQQTHSNKSFLDAVARKFLRINIRASTLARVDGSHAASNANPGECR